MENAIVVTATKVSAIRVSRRLLIGLLWSVMTCCRQNSARACHGVHQSDQRSRRQARREHDLVGDARSAATVTVTVIDSTSPDAYPRAQPRSSARRKRLPIRSATNLARPQHDPTPRRDNLPH